MAWTGWQRQPVKYAKALLGLAYSGCPLAGPFELVEMGPTNPIVEIWGRQDGPALPVHTYMGLTHGPSRAEQSCVIILSVNDGYAARIRGPPSNHHVPRRIMLPPLPLSQQVQVQVRVRPFLIGFASVLVFPLSSNSRVQCRYIYIYMWPLYITRNHSACNGAVNNRNAIFDQFIYSLAIEMNT